MSEALVTSKQSNVHIRQLISRVLAGEIGSSDTRELLKAGHWVGLEMHSVGRKMWESAVIRASDAEKQSAYAAYAANQEAWERLYPGQWVLVRGDEIVHAAESWEEFQKGILAHTTDSGPIGVSMEIVDPKTIIR